MAINKGIWEKVESSNLSRVQYDPENQQLVVEFKSKKVYEYENVSEEEHYDLVNAPSVGKYFNENIKHKPFKQLR